MYIDENKIDRALRELRRVGYDRFLFCEPHSKNWLARVYLRVSKGYSAYDYEKLMKDHYFKGTRLHKIPKEAWGGHLWGPYGYVITALR